MNAEEIYNSYFRLIVNTVKSKNYLFYRGRLTQDFEDITHSIYLYLCENMIEKDNFEISEVCKMINKGFDKYRSKNKPRCCTNYDDSFIEKQIINSSICDCKTDGVAQEIEQIIDWSNKEEYDNRKKRK